MPCSVSRLLPVAATSSLSSASAALMRLSVRVSSVISSAASRRRVLPGHCCVGRSRRAETGAVMSSGSSSSSVFAGFRFPREVISVAVRWYLRYGLSYRNVEELLAERGISVDHVTIYRWVQRFTAEFIEAAQPCRHAPGNRWFVDETLPEDRRQVDLSLPGGRSAWPGHRRPAIRKA